MNQRKTFVAAMAGLLLPAIGAAAQTEAGSGTNNFQDDGTVHVPAFDLPLSQFVSPEMRKAMVAARKNGPKLYENAVKNHVPLDKVFDEQYWPPLIAAQQARYPVNIEARQIAGIYTEIFTPRAGVRAANTKRVLINLHGGGMRIGARTGGRVESIPIAGVGGYKVISIDYRQAPQYHYPAASQDITAVYREVLKEYKPENVGFYGCSSGGYLISNLIGWFQKEGVPRPGAVGIFGAGAAYGAFAQSAYSAAAISGQPAPLGKIPMNGGMVQYYQGTSLEDPMINPLVSPALLHSFPPTLLVNGMQDYNFGESVHFHNELIRNGVDARLHLWEGGGHCFHYDPDVPESRDTYEVIVKFFDGHLGK